MACIGRAPADGGDDPTIRQQFDYPVGEVVGPLLGVAFLEQHAALRQLAEDGLARERPEVLVLEPVER